MPSKKKRVNNILSSIKPNNYVPRVVEVPYKKIMEGGRTVDRVKTKHTTPFVELDRSILHAMHQLPHQKSTFLPDPYQQSTRKNPRIVNNSKKTNKRGSRKPVAKQVLNPNAVKLLKEGGKPSDLLNNFGKIDKRFLKTVVS